MRIHNAIEIGPVLLRIILTLETSVFRFLYKGGSQYLGSIEISSPSAEGLLVQLAHSIQ